MPTITRSFFVCFKLINLFAAISFLALSCHRGQVAFPEKIDYQSVLDKYSRPKDSLKLKAAEFLIYNLPKHTGYYGEDIKHLSETFDIIDTLTYKNGPVEDYIKNQILDSLVKKYHHIGYQKDKEISDDRKVMPAYLINNIEFAFKAWQKAPWKDKVNFAAFCEYILPYRVRDEQLEIWRPQTYKAYIQTIKNATKPGDLQSVYEYMKGNAESETNLNGYFGQQYPYTQNFSNTLKGKIGACESTTSGAVNILRSVGIPAALDYIPHWGNTNNRNHYVVQLIEKKMKRGLFSNENGPVSTWGIVDFSSDYSKDHHLFSDNEIPKGMYIQYIKTIPKIYRFTFSEDVLLKEINESVPRNFISPGFKRANLKDVTSEYMPSSSRLIDIPSAYQKNEVAYLCVFDVDGWQPVAISRINSANAFFDNLGNYVVYLPAVYDHGKIQPVGTPFFLDSLNLIHDIKPEKGFSKKVNLIRKAPLYSYTAYHTEVLKGGRFEGANNKDFKNAVTFYQINNFPFYMNEIHINLKKRFRYLRYVAPAGHKNEADNIAEVQFYGINGAKPLRGEFMGKKEGSWDHGIDKAFDNDLNSYYESSSPDNVWIGLDIGKSSTISTIKFCPRNDTNCILPGNEYELLYWNNEWISLGIKKARDFELHYANIPENALLWLKCNSGGREERIFTLNKGMQHWW